MQEHNPEDTSRYCLLHHGVGYQRTYDGTSSLKKLKTEFDKISEKYKDVWSDGSVIPDDDSSDGDVGSSEIDRDDDASKSLVRERARGRGRISKATEEESSDDDDDDVVFGGFPGLETKPHALLDDDDDDDGSENNVTSVSEGHSHKRRRIDDDDGE